MAVDKIKTSDILSIKLPLQRQFFYMNTKQYQLINILTLVHFRWIRMGGGG